MSEDKYDFLGGIRPEDVKVPTLEEQAQLDAFKADMELESEYDPIEIYESEINAVLKLLQELRDKYFFRTATFAELTSLKNEANEKFGKLGFTVHVDWILSGLAVTPQPPTITIIGRTSPFDPEREAFEIGKGVADEYYNRKRERMKKKK